MFQCGGNDRAEALGQRLSSAETVAPEERRLAGAVNGVFYLLGGITLASFMDHAELSARIVEGVLAPEQVDWIRTQHERPDGGGYPDRLTHVEISEGAALLALADAYDVMTIGRPYSVPKTVQQALGECESLIVRQFTRRAVGALMQLHECHEPGNVEPARAVLAGR